MELSLLVSDIGMSPMEAIVAATSTSPAALAIQDSTGTIEAGKKADLWLYPAIHSRISRCWRTRRRSSESMWTAND
ncbi:amidohydrolase family protein [Paenibacillus dendritiformis]|uniref:amidohydrolase family protein n=1 Tax=Paenibacillus dendritiformis TaxID=130049 RepID=UPI00143DDD32|nr:amidohydrolase family protein [Paenibacillus dendritiformis]NRG00551.1 amidohydrolase family protein [Paenibacillus dendritiformis]